MKIMLTNVFLVPRKYEQELLDRMKTWYQVQYQSQDNNKSDLLEVSSQYHACLQVTYNKTFYPVSAILVSLLIDKIGRWMFSFSRL